MYLPEPDRGRESLAEALRSPLDFPPTERRRRELSTRIPRAALALSVVTGSCALIASTATLLWAGAFPEPGGHAGPNTVLAEARGWSAATLLVALPILVASLARASGGSMRARLLWIGSLAYFVYTYLELAVSPPFTALYLVYIVAFGCAIPAFAMGVATVEVRGLPEKFGRGRARRTVAAFAIGSSALLFLAWFGGIAARIVTGTFGWPAGDAAVGHVVRALDLGLQVPLGIATAMLLIRDRPWGYVVAAVFLVMSVCMGGALTAMVAWRSIVAGESEIQAVPFAIVWAAALALAVGYFRMPRGHERERRHDRPDRPLA